MLLTLAVFYFLNVYITGQGMILFALIETGMMWVIIVALLLIADNNRVLTEELKELIQEHIKESKTLQKIRDEELQEIRLLKKVAKQTKRKSKK